MLISVITLPVSEWKTYQDLRLRAIQDSPQAFLDTHEQTASFPEVKWRQRLKDTASGKSWQFFAKLNRKLVGMIGAFRSDPDVKNKSATIVGLWIFPEARGKGVGRQLMEALLDELRKKKSIKTVHLSVNVEQTSAVALYKKLGFQVTGESTGVMGDGKKHTELIMEKTLT